MRKMMIFCLVFLPLLSAVAELQNVEVGGEIRIRGNYIYGNYNSPSMFALRWPALAGVNTLQARPIGDMVSYVFSGGNPAAVRGNGVGILSPYSWDQNTNSLQMVEQRTRLHVKADFTNEVSAFIELDSYDWWGEDFRSNWITGADGRANTIDDVEVFQAYIEAENMWGLPLRARIGRQELMFGNEWLVGNKDFGPFFRGLSFDALRLTYTTDVFTLDAWASTLAEGGVAEEDGDVWFYGLYGSCTAVENWTFDAYWLWLRDARSLNDTNFIWFVEWLEDVFGVDDYDVTNIHTVGLRASGMVDAFDINAEIAYQWGNAGQVGFVFKPFLYGDDRADYSAWAGTIEVGYTFDMSWQPRVSLGFDYYGGEDNRDISWFEWWWPFDRPQASVSFNRLFSDKMYTGFIDLHNDLSNVWIGRGSVMVHPTENVMVMAVLAYFQAIETFDSPVYFDLGGFRIPIAPALSFWTRSNSADIGWELTIYGEYHYSEDLTFALQLSTLWPGDGLKDGNFIAWNGLVSGQGSDDDVSTYATAEVRLKF